MSLKTPRGVAGIRDSDGTDDLIRMDRQDRAPNYDRSPFLPAGNASDLSIGWDLIASRISSTGARVIVLEAYPGVHRRDLEEVVTRLSSEVAICAEEALKTQAEVTRMIEPDLTDDPVFGRITRIELIDFFDLEKLQRLRAQVASSSGRVIVYGTGAALVANGDLLVYADMARWEIQQRQRSGEIANFGSSDFALDSSLKYKRAFFVDWRVADRHKRALAAEVDFVIDTIDPGRPKMSPAGMIRKALARAAKSPFRVLPFFDPAPWGGQWMKKVCNLNP
jgi:hypothetical protein